MLRLLKNLGRLAIVGAFAVVFCLGYFYYTLNLDRPLASGKTIIIPKGSSLPVIAETLQHDGIIKHKYLFIATALITKKNKALKAGEYKFSANISLVEAMDKIARGDMVKHQITIPEGLTSEEILKLITDNIDLSESITVNASEGELLPETYSFSYGYTRDELIRRMIKARKEFLDQAWEERAANLPIASKEQAIILASIVEKETGTPEERPKVAAVFINRLNKGMPLQSDPTVIYAITNGKKELGRGLTLNDLKIDSPYNTYIVQGLPPTPIANPGKKSIEAVLNPADTKDLYFVASGTGGHLFSETLTEHNHNVQKYRNLQKAR